VMQLAVSDTKISSSRHFRKISSPRLCFPPFSPDIFAHHFPARSSKPSSLPFSLSCVASRKQAIFFAGESINTKQQDPSELLPTSDFRLPTLHEIRDDTAWKDRKLG